MTLIPYLVERPSKTLNHSFVHGILNSKDTPDIYDLSQKTQEYPHAVNTPAAYFSLLWGAAFVCLHAVGHHLQLQYFKPVFVGLHNNEHIITYT